MGGDPYIKRQEEQFLEYEALCKRCGVCCDASRTDPCENLIKGEDGKSFCRVYDNRLGLQKTVSGRSFVCVPIRDVQRYGVIYNNCGYNK